MENGVRKSVATAPSGADLATAAEALTHDFLTEMAVGGDRDDIAAVKDESQIRRLRKRLAKAGQLKAADSPKIRRIGRTSYIVLARDRYEEYLALLDPPGFWPGDPSSDIWLLIRDSGERPLVLVEAPGVAEIVSYAKRRAVELGYEFDELRASLQGTRREELLPRKRAAGLIVAELYERHLASWRELGRAFGRSHAAIRELYASHGKAELRRKRARYDRTPAR
jgi:hypothetical protein